ncbi:MAG: DUF350 domain-containing protein [Flammeovirgaceae bacterium]|nr:DUF350 domain-containing protein [Flammeovirgaceae bacterium]MDW8286716.1 DUF350 domain-containing protein [Flammeovirgaceae bacterium]
MSSQQILFGSYHLILALIFGITTVLISLAVVGKFKLNKTLSESMAENNIAISIFKGAWVICSLILVENSLEPSVNALRTMVFTKDAFTFKMLLISFGYFILFYGISIAFSILVLAAVFYAFIKMTPLDEVEEIKKNNVAVALIVSLAMFAITMFIHPAYDNFMNSLINYDRLENMAKDLKVPEKKKNETISPKMPNYPDGN